MPNNSKKLVAVNERGYRIGEDHPCAVLTDRDIELLFQLHEEGWGYRRLAAKFDCSKSLVRRILKGEVRGQHPTRFKPMP
jgi:Mor family transcriptional regulator